MTSRLLGVCSTAVLQPQPYTVSLKVLILLFQAKDLDGPTQGGGQVFYPIKSVNTDATVFNIDPISGTFQDCL